MSATTEVLSQQCAMEEGEGEESQLELWNGGTIGPDFNDDDPLFMTDKFRMYCYKVLPCSKRFCHDWSTCPFAHFSERAKRRDPRTAKYTAIACPEMKKQGEPCPRGDKCPYSHNTFEYWLHPTRYRTRICRDGEGCTRKVCFFAHKPEDVRVPPCRPSLPVADDPWPASDESTDSGFDAPFGTEPAGKTPRSLKRGGSTGSDASKGLSGRLSDMLKKIPSRQPSNGFHQPCSQDLGSTFFGKVLESIRDGGSSPSDSSPKQMAETLAATVPNQEVTTAQLGQAVTNLLSNLCLQNQGVGLPQQVQPDTAVLEALVNQASMPNPSMGGQSMPLMGAPLGALPNMQPGFPLGYFPVTPGGLPPGMAPMPGPEGMHGMPAGVPLNMHTSQLPFNGVSHGVTPDVITSAHGMMNLPPNGGNMNDLIQTILSLQSQGHHPVVGPQYIGANGYVHPQGNGIPQQVMMSNGMMAPGQVINGNSGVNGVQKGVGLVDENRKLGTGVPSSGGPTDPVSEGAKNLEGDVSVPLGSKPSANGMQNLKGSVSITADGTQGTGFPPGLSHPPGYMRADGMARNLSGIV